MDSDKVNEEIALIINARNKLWGMFLITLGGSFLLALNIHNNQRFFIVIPGLIMSIFFLIAYRSKNTQIEKLHLNLENEQD